MTTKEKMKQIIENHPDDLAEQNIMMKRENWQDGDCIKLCFLKKDYYLKRN
jgi:hypothetical protein